MRPPLVTQESIRSHPDPNHPSNHYKVIKVHIIVIAPSNPEIFGSCLRSNILHGIALHAHDLFTSYPITNLSIHINPIPMIIESA